MQHRGGACLDRAELHAESNVRSQVDIRRRERVPQQVFALRDGSFEDARDTEKVRTGDEIMVLPMGLFSLAGFLRDIRGVKTVGVIAEYPERGITEIARPVGVVAAITPSTNPAATPANQIINALKCGNAIIIAPSPKGYSTCQALLGYVHAELRRVGAPLDLAGAPQRGALVERLARRHEEAAGHPFPRGARGRRAGHGRYGGGRRQAGPAIEGRSSGTGIRH